MRATVIAIEGTSNVRDLGGMPARDGRAIAPGRLYRGEALVLPGTSSKAAVWSEAQRDAYRALALETVIDLRGVPEVTQAPSAWARASHARLVLLPVSEGGEGDATDYVRQLKAGTLRSFSAADLAAFYAATVRQRATVFGRAIRELSARDRLPALVHCSAGKDRTGLLVALVLEALGTARDEIVADYALTGILRPNRVAAYADILAPHGIEPDAVRALFETPPAAMTGLLDGLDGEFGSVAEFLRGPCGLGQTTLDALAAALLDEG
jgi:protein-tyrosine phosphatase